MREEKDLELWVTMKSLTINRELVLFTAMQQHSCSPTYSKSTILLPSSLTPPLYSVQSFFLRENIIIITCLNTLSVLGIVVLVLIYSVKTSKAVYQKLNVFGKLLTDCRKHTMSTLVHSTIGIHKSLKDSPSCLYRAKLIEIGNRLIESVAAIEL